MANIDSQINDRMQMYAGNPQGLMQRYAQTQELVDLLALQKMKNDRAAATSAVQGAMQPPPGTVKGQLEQEAMQGARNDVMRSMAPGIQQRGRQMAQMQNRAAMGIPTQAAPNMPRMAMGGIVGYQAGGDVMVGPPEPNMLQRMGQGLKNMGGNMAESSDILRAAKAGIGVPYENRAAAIQQVRDEIAAQKQNRDPNFIQRMGQKLMDMGLNVQESNRILKEAYSNIGKTYEERAKGMAMGGIVGYQEGGGVKSYQTGAMVESDMSRFGIEDEIELSPEVARALDLQRNRNIGRAYLDPETGEPMSLGRRIGRLFQGDRGETYEDPNRMTPEELDAYPKPAEIRRAMRNLPEEERLSPQDLNAMNLEEKQAFGAQKAIEQRAPQEVAPQGSGITAGMYDVRNMMAPTNKQKLGSMVDRPSAVFKDNMADRKKPERDIDLRPLREFLLGGAGQTSTAGALAGGARGLGAFQAAEQARADKIQQAANELQLKRDLAANEAAMLDRKLLADYQGKLTTAEIGVVQDILEQLNDPYSATGSEYDARAKRIRDQYERDPVVMEEALLRLKKQFLQQGLNAVRQSVLGEVPPTGTQIAGAASRISE